MNTTQFTEGGETLRRRRLTTAPQERRYLSLTSVFVSTRTHLNKVAPPKPRCVPTAGKARSYFDTKSYSSYNPYFHLLFKHFYVRPCFSPALPCPPPHPHPPSLLQQLQGRCSDGCCAACPRFSPRPLIDCCPRRAAARVPGFKPLPHYSV